METLNKKYDLAIEVITPLHVGSGAEKDWVQGSDFITDNNQVKILNLKKVSQYVNITDLTNALLRKDSETIKNKLGNNLPHCIDKTFKGIYFGNNDIKTFLKNGLTNKPIIPGSSIKGAIRSILLEYLMDEKGKQEAIAIKRLNEQSIFGKANEGDEFMRFIKVSDAQFENTEICNTKIFNLKNASEGGWKHGGNNTTNNYRPDGFNSFYEIIDPMQKSVLSISIADKAFNNYADKIKIFSAKKSQIVQNNISGFFRIINLHTKKYLEKEKAFFEKYTTDKTDKIIEGINSLIRQIPENGEHCILKMSAGSGFHNITGDWQFDDFSIDKIDGTRRNRGNFKGKESAKSRKIAIYENQFTLMGFIKLKVRTEEEIRLENEATIRKQKELEQKRIEEENAKAEGIRLMKEKEEAEKLEQLKKEEKARQNELERIAEEQQKEADRIAREEEAEKQRIAKREQDIKSGLSFLNNIDSFDKVGNRVADWLKKSGNTIIPDSELPILKDRIKIWQQKAKQKPRDLKEFEKFCKFTILKWVGNETAQKWFEELFIS